MKKMSDITILYYTANSENKTFEANIIKNTLSLSNGLPIISVSQEPLEGFGKNICVGKKENCYHNEFRQILIGLYEIETPLVLVAEADFLYPPEYFMFVPDNYDKCYRFGNVWVHTKKLEYIYQYKQYSDGAQILGKDKWIGIIEEALSGRSEWGSKDDAPLPYFRIPTDDRYVWNSFDPAVTFKTGKGVSPVTNTKRGVEPRESLPYWGSAKRLIDEMEGNSWVR